MEKGRRVRIPSAGGYEKLVLEDFDIPKPATGEALVKINYAGVNYADICVR